MRVCMLAPEAFPYAKTGGLADVLAALPAALARARGRGHGRCSRPTARPCGSAGAVERLGPRARAGVEPPRAGRRSCGSPGARVPTLMVRGSALLRSRRAVRRRRPRLTRTTPSASPSSVAPRSSGCAGSARPPTSSTATTGRRRSRRPCCAPRRALYPELRRVRLVQTDPQPRLPGPLLGCRLAPAESRQALLHAARRSSSTATSAS